MAFRLAPPYGWFPVFAVTAELCDIRANDDNDRRHRRTQEGQNPILAFWLKIVSWEINEKTKAPRDQSPRKNKEDWLMASPQSSNLSDTKALRDQCNKCPKTFRHPPKLMQKAFQMDTTLVLLSLVPDTESVISKKR